MNEEEVPSGNAPTLAAVNVVMANILTNVVVAHISAFPELQREEAARSIMLIVNGSQRAAHVKETEDVSPPKVHSLVDFLIRQVIAHVGKRFDSNKGEGSNFH